MKVAFSCICTLLSQPFKTLPRSPSPQFCLPLLAFAFYAPQFLIPLSLSLFSAPLPHNPFALISVLSKHLEFLKLLTIEVAVLFFSMMNFYKALLLYCYLCNKERVLYLSLFLSAAHVFDEPDFCSCYTYTSAQIECSFIVCAIFNVNLVCKTFG